MSSKVVSVGSLALPPERYTFSKIFVKHQIRPNPKPSFDETSVAQQTAIITGGNGGIGLECGRIMLSLQLGHLILGVRSLKKGEEAAGQLRKDYPRNKIEVWHLDMDSYDSIWEFARKCSFLDRLDIVLLSAGIMNVEQAINPLTGYEEMFQVNYLSTALLAVALLPVLEAKRTDGRSGRLTLIASGAALIAEFAEHKGEALFSSFRRHDAWDATTAKKAYDTSKGLVLMLALRLGTLVAAEDIVVNVVDPSFTPGTSFFRSLPFLFRVAV